MGDDNFSLPLSNLFVIPMKTKKNSILDAIHETASDLSILGFIDKRSMDHYDALCAPSIPDYPPEQVK